MTHSRHEMFWLKHTFAMLRVVILSEADCLRNRSPRNAGNKKNLRAKKNIQIYISQAGNGKLPES